MIKKNKLIEAVKYYLFSAAVGVGLAYMTPVVAAEGQANSVAEAFQGGTTNIGFRYRYEEADVSGNGLKKGEASTLKTRLTYQTMPYHNFSALAEVDNVSTIGSDRYNSTRNGNTDRETVADPKGTDINQVYLDYAGLDNTTLRFGRQRVNLDNQRFIGGVAWRQNEQTYNAAALISSPFEDFTTMYGYVDRVNRIYGPDSGTPPEKLSTTTHLLNLNYKATPLANISAYYYELDIPDAAALSSNTLGFRVTGAQDALGYAVEYAQQSEEGDNPTKYDADYSLFEGSYKASNVTTKLGYEILGSDSGVGFSTPLATGHKFQGWADKFLTTPTTGINDKYIAISAPVSGVILKAAYHDFEADSGSGNYGSEIDFSLAEEFGEHYGLLVKYARYDADDATIDGAANKDTTKLWLQLTADF